MRLLSARSERPARCGERADKFWLVTAGHVALDLRKPGQANLIVQTLGSGDVLGLSWLSPPYEWQFGAVAVEATAAFELDGAAVLALCDSRPEFGYQVARRMAAVASQRLHATRIRLLDLCACPARSLTCDDPVRHASPVPGRLAGAEAHDTVKLGLEPVDQPIVLHRPGRQHQVMGRYARVYAADTPARRVPRSWP